MQYEIIFVLRHLPRPCTISSYSIDECSTSVVGLSSVLLLDPDQDRIIYHNTQSQQSYGQQEAQLISLQSQEIPHAFQDQQENVCNHSEQPDFEHQEVVYHGVHQSSHSSPRCSHQPAQENMNHLGISPGSSKEICHGFQAENEQICQATSCHHDLQYQCQGTQFGGHQNEAYTGEARMCGYEPQQECPQDPTKSGFAGGVTTATIYTTWATVSDTRTTSIDIG